MGSDDLWAEKGIIAPMRDHTLGEILYTKWRVLLHEANLFYAQEHGLVEAGKRGSRQHSTQGR